MLTLPRFREATPYSFAAPLPRCYRLLWKRRATTGCNRGGSRGYFYFQLNDGSTTGFDFNIIDGYGTNGIQLPDLLLKTILRGSDIPEGF